MEDEDESPNRPKRTMEQLIKGIINEEDKCSSEELSEGGYCSSDDEFDPSNKHKPVQPKVIVLQKTTNKTIDHFPNTDSEIES